MTTNDVQEELGDLSNTIFADGLKSCSSSPLEGGLLGDPDTCGICMNKLVMPRVLSCLHIFCEQCLDKKLVDEAGDAGNFESVIVCVTCKQETKVGLKKAASLPLDIVSTNVIDVTNMANLTCTCCTTKEMAISRCCTCHNLLCNNCNSAHQYMRCFENHKVLMLEELKVSGGKIPVHKTLACEVHAGEPVASFCLSCQQLACTECLKAEHRAPLHQCEAVSDAEPRVKQELETLVAEGRARADFLLQASAELEAALGELANERSVARDLINETCQSYRAVVERCRDDALAQLNRLHHERELALLEATHRVGKDVSLLEDACRFASRLLDNANVAELMYMKQAVTAQLVRLVNDSPRPDHLYHIEFESEYERFEQAAKGAFGLFRTETTPSRKLTGSPSLAAALAGTANGYVPNGSLTNSSPISLPASMQSSFDGELASASVGVVSLSHAVLGPDSPPAATAAALGFTTIAEYNLQQLASLAEKVELSEPVVQPSSAPSPTPSFTLADLFTGDLTTANTAYHNLQALAKLNGFGPVSSSTSPIMSGTPDDGGGGGPNAGPQQLATVQRQGKVTPMQIRCKFGQLGPSKGQFNSPHGFCLGLEEDIIVADTNNHRIQVFEKTGTYKFQFGIPGKDEGQLWYPRKVAVMRLSGKYVVCDRGNERSRMQIFTKNGHFIKKIAIRYIDIVAGLAVTALSEIVAVDSVSPTVFVISENGELLRWFDCSDFMREPSDIAIHGKEYYVCDFKGHNVVVFSEQGEFLRRIGCENITNFPNGIDISDAGDVLIGDSHGNRFHVAVFARDGSLVTEFECPYVKVSRCCGLKITSEGYVVTLAKNNHHVLVLNTLYIL